MGIYEYWDGNHYDTDYLDTDYVEDEIGEIIKMKNIINLCFRLMLILNSTFKI